MFVVYLPGTTPVSISSAVHEWTENKDFSESTTNSKVFVTFFPVERYGSDSQLLFATLATAS